MGSDLKVRLAGVGCILAGAAISWPAIFDRLRMARQGAETITTWSTASFLVGPLIVIGLTMIILGEKAGPMTRDAEKKRITPFGNFVALASAAAGFAGMLGTNYLLSSYGYQL